MKILIVNPFGIGDVLFTTPLIKALKKNIPGCVIGYWCNERVSALFKNNRNIDKIFALSRGDLKKLYRRSRVQAFRAFFSLCKSIHKEKFDLAFDFSLDYRYGLILKLLRIKRRIGFNFKNRGRFLTDKNELSGYTEKHMVEYYMELLKFLDLGSADITLDLPVTEISMQKAKHIFSRYGITQHDMVVALAPGAGASWGKNSAFKHWSAMKYAQLADRITSDKHVKVILLGDEHERAIADVISNVLKGKVIDLVGKTDVDDLLGILSRTSILISNDGGILHLAVALGVKTVSMFGPVDERVYGPYPPSEAHIVVTLNLSCRPCYRNFRFLGCQNDQRCLKDITVDEVYAAYKRLVDASCPHKSYSS